MNNPDMEIHRGNYNEIIHNMRRLLETFYGDVSKEHVSFYSLLNKLNTDMKRNPELSSKIQQAKHSQNVACTFT